jgi:hypothetical protein
MRMEGTAAVSLAQKGDGNELLLRRSPERDGPDSDRGPRFKTAASLTEPIMPGLGSAEISGTRQVVQANDPPALAQAPTEGPESERSNVVCPLPDDVYVQDCYQRILELRSTMSKGAVVDGINSILWEMAEKAQKEGSSYTAMVNNTLMRHWTRKEGESTSYDEFMQTHVDAISVLIKSWMTGKTLSGKKIKILEASCGTGAVLEAFLDAIPPEMYRKLRIVANDVSSSALETTRKRLARFEGRVRIEYTQNDLTQQVPNGRFDFILLSQTLPFLNDENALRAQRLGLALPNESRHITTKRKVLETLVNRLKPGSGELLIIDEYPMRLSKIPDDFDSIVEDSLFREIFRPLSRGMLINDVMKRIERGRFRVHAEAFIDREHSMYLIGSSNQTNTACNDTRSAKQQQANDDDTKKIIARAETLHRELIGHLQTFEEEGGTVYRPINAGEKRLEIDQAIYDERIGHKPGYWRTNGNYNLVILKGLVHHIGQEDYRCLIDKLKKHHKIGPGSAILFIDEWPAPPESPYPVGNGDARSLIFGAFDDQVFCGSVRCGNKYGYLYVVRNL